MVVVVVLVLVVVVAVVVVSGVLACVQRSGLSPTDDLARALEEFYQVVEPAKLSNVPQIVKVRCVCVVCVCVRP